MIRQLTFQKAGSQGIVFLRRLSVVTVDRNNSLATSTLTSKYVIKTGFGH